MRLLLVLLIGLTLASSLLPTSGAQATPIWRVLPEAPVSPVGRHDDVHFFNEQIGWVCNLSGEIWKTTNGGASWVAVLDTLEAFRSITFVDSLRGWAGSLFDVNLLWETFDGGLTWSVVDSIPDPRPAGICGLYPVNDQVIYGTSKFNGPATVIKTVDGGATWTTLDLSAHASTLIDCYFVSPDSGFVTGGIGTFQNQTQAIVLSTGDGGATWDNRWVGSRLQEWGWKISFPTPMVAYISLESGVPSSNYFLKSVDGGATWTDIWLGSGSPFREQGIGFANPSLGWVGGSAGLAYETTDGGTTWLQTDWGHQLNRIFMIDETLGYAVGQTVYKYSEDDVTDVVGGPPPPPAVQLALHQNRPNPFNPTTTIRYVIDRDATIRLLVYDVQGRMVRKLVDQLESAGEHVVVWDGRDASGESVASGLYFYRLESDDFAEVRKMTLLK